MDSLINAPFLNEHHRQNEWNFGGQSAHSPAREILGLNANTTNCAHYRARAVFLNPQKR
jgi:hypothetical protein